MFEVLYWQSVLNGEWYFHVRDAGNHAVLATSEGYHNEADCRATASRFGPPQRVGDGEPAGPDGR